MPTPLLDRCRPHSVAEFRAAALQRYADAEILYQHDHRTVALYLYGYTAEMLLKASWFAAFGFGPDDRIGLPDIQAAIKLAPSLGVLWPTPVSAHNIAAWGQSLFRLRSAIAGAGYHDPAIGAGVIDHSARVYELWRETLRYHRNVAYPYEVKAVRRAVEWLVANSLRL